MFKVEQNRYLFSNHHHRFVLNHLHKVWYIQNQDEDLLLEHHYHKSILVLRRHKTQNRLLNKIQGIFQ